VRLDTGRLRTLEEVRAFMQGSRLVAFRLAARGKAYDFVRRTLVRFGHLRPRPPEKGLVKRYLGKVTGLSQALRPDQLL